MAQFNADINLQVQVDNALAGIRKVEARINQIKSNTIDFKINRASDGRNELNRLGDSFKRLGGTLKNAGIVTAIAGITASLKELNSLPVIGGGLDTSAIGRAVDQLGSFSAAAAEAAASAPLLAAGLTAATVAAVAFAPQIGRAAKDTILLAKAAGKAAVPLKQVLDLIASASVGRAAFGGEQLLEASKFAELYRQSLFEASTNVSELTRKQSVLSSTLNKYNSSSETALKIAGRLVTVNSQLNNELREQKDLLRQAAGVNVTELEASKGRNSIETRRRRESFIEEEEAKRKQLLETIQAAEIAGVDRVFSVKLTRLEELYSKQLSLEKEANAAALKDFDDKLDDQLRSKQRQYKSPIGPGNGEGERAFRREQQLFGDVDKATTDAVNALTKVNSLGKTLDKQKADTARRIDQVTFDAKIEALEEAAKKELALNKRINDKEVKDFDARLRKQDAARKKKSKARKQLGQDLALGVGFPLLFGAGPGGVGGGALGALAGRGEGGFGLQILFSALGTQLDELGTATAQTAQDLKDPITNLSALNESFSLFNKETTKSIEKLQELGRAQEALSVIQGRLIEVIGTRGLDNFASLASEADAASRRLGELGLQLQAALAGPIAQFLRLVNQVLGQGGNDFTNEPGRRQFQLSLSAKDSVELEKLKKEAVKDIGVFDFAVRNAAKEDVFTDFAKELQGRVELTPELKQKDADIALANAEKEFALVEQGVALERRVIDFRRNTAKQVFDFQQKAAALERSASNFRRSIEDRIFKQRQEVARQEIANDRKRAQLAIERADLSLAGLKEFDNAPGRGEANALIDAARAYLKTRAEGEAELQQKERLFVLDIEKIQKAGADFELQVARKIEALNRSAAEFNRSIADGRINAERQMFDIRKAAADYSLAQTKERIRLEEDAAKKLAMTRALVGSTGVTGRTGGGQSGPSRGRSSGPHLHAQAGAGVNIREFLDRALNFGGGRTASSFGTSRGAAGHGYNAIDYLTPQSTPFSLNPGYSARDMGVQGALGQGLEVTGPNGISVVLGHLDEVATKLEGAAESHDHAAHAIEHAVTQPELPTGDPFAGITAPGAPDVSGLVQQSQALSQSLAASKADALGIYKSFKDLNDEQLAQTFGQAVSQSVAQLNAPLDNLLESTTKRIEGEREYARLIAEGISPNVARITVDTQQQVALQQEKLALQVQSLEAVIAQAEAEGKNTEELRKQLELLQGQAKVLQGKGQTVVDAAAQDDKGKKIRDYMTQLQTGINDTDGAIVSLAQSVEGTLSSSISSMVTGLIDGTTTVEQAMSEMFAGIGQAFIQMATQMLAQKLVLSLLGGLFPGSSSAVPGLGASGGGTPLGPLLGSMPFIGSGRAGGGPVNGGSPYMVGENGPELFIPGVSGSISNNDQFEAARSAMGGSSSGADNAFADNTSSISTTNSYMREREYETNNQTTVGGAGSMVIETQVINNVEYASVEQVRVASEAAAKQARAQVFSDMKNKPSRRAMVGLT